MNYAYVFLLSFALGAFSGWKVDEWRHGELKAEELREVRKDDLRRSEITARAADTTEAAKAKERVVTKTLIREVYKYVPAVAENCYLSPRWRLYHDAAVDGVPLPDPASKPDAASVAPAEAAAAVADNYGACRENTRTLEGLQDWVRKQQKTSK